MEIIIPWGTNQIGGGITKTKTSRVWNKVCKLKNKK